MIDEQTSDRIVRFITDATEPVHSTEIANALGNNRVTIAKYLSVLQSQGLISFKNIGMAKVWTTIENPVLLSFEKNDQNSMAIQTFNALTDGVSVLDREMRVVWLNREMERRHGKLEKRRGGKCFEIFHEEKDICKNCPVKATFESGKGLIMSFCKKKEEIEISTSPLKDSRGRTIAVIEIVRVAKRGK